MHLAAELARVDIVEMLLKAGVDLTLFDKVRRVYEKRTYCHQLSDMFAVVCG